MKFLNTISLSPSDYVENAFLANDVGTELISRLDLININPKIILDLGCGPSLFSEQFRTRYPQCEVIGIDCSLTMLEFARNINSSTRYMCAYANELPFKDHTIDFIFANMFIPWCAKLPELLRELRRVLRPNGLIMFSALGLDTLKFLQASMPRELPYLHDMHDIGDAFIQQGFVDPVLDVSNYTVTYSNYVKLIKELYCSEMLHSLTDIDNHVEHNPNPKGQWEINYEIIFGHAFIEIPTRSVSNEGIIKIPVNSITTLKK